MAYAAVTSIATIGLYIAYVLPTLLRRIKGKSWEGGRWSLGKWSPLVGWVSIIWVAFIAVLFMLPEVSFSTINRDNFNYAPVAVGVVLLFSGGYWLISARKWFKGPRSQGDEGAAAQDRGGVRHHRARARGGGLSPWRGKPTRPGVPVHSLVKAGLLGPPGPIGPEKASPRTEVRPVT